MKRLGLAAALVLATAGAADAKVLDLYAQAEGGGGYGQGISGVQKDNDFFEGAAGPLYGARVGAEFLFVDGFVEHLQYYDGTNLRTWTQFMIGGDWDFPIGDAEPGKKPKTFGEIGFAGGYGVGTGQQVMPPLDASELTDKGFMGQLSFGADWRFSSVLSLGITVPISYGYMFKKGAANNEDNQYQSINVAAFVHLRFHLELK